MTQKDLDELVIILEEAEKETPQWYREYAYNLMLNALKEVADPNGDEVQRIIAKSLEP